MLNNKVSDVIVTPLFSIVVFAVSTTKEFKTG